MTNAPANHFAAATSMESAFVSILANSSPAVRANRASSGRKRPNANVCQISCAILRAEDARNQDFQIALRIPIAKVIPSAGQTFWACANVLQSVRVSLVHPTPIAEPPVTRANACVVRDSLETPTTVTDADHYPKINANRTPSVRMLKRANRPMEFVNVCPLAPPSDAV